MFDELYEAVYLFNKFPFAINNESVVKAVKRILVANGLLDYGGYRYQIKNKEEHRYILDNIIAKNPKRYEEFFNKAANESQFFFDSISELEYEIYSRCNFQVTYETGKQAAKYLNLTGLKVLELGGNSGGFAAAVLEEKKDCFWTVVDTRIPCEIGREFNEASQLNLTFIEGDVFKLALPDEEYGYIVLMNLLHDFDDGKCLEILRSCLRYSGENTKILVIEDILTNDFEPKKIVMHGLRLSVECRGGRQRTVEEFKKLLHNVNLGIEKAIKLSEIHTMLVI